MVLAIDKHSALFVFRSTQDAELSLEAIDVQQDEFEFCDVCGQRYAVTYPKPPNQVRFTVDVGEFKLVPAGNIQPNLPEQFLGRATHIERSFAEPPLTIEILRAEIRKAINR